MQPTLPPAASSGFCWLQGPRNSAAWWSTAKAKCGARQIQGPIPTTSGRGLVPDASAWSGFYAAGIWLCGEGEYRACGARFKSNCKLHDRILEPRHLASKKSQFLVPSTCAGQLRSLSTLWEGAELARTARKLRVRKRSHGIANLRVGST